jgi:patatin-related protein
MSNEDQSRYTQEIRFAVVMYGGVSLAIYMNGIAQEMLRLVRSTSIEDPELLGDAERIYREIACLLHHGRRPGNGDTAKAPQTRFVIDLLSGTSAGGINAVFLAKALAMKAKDLEDLRNLWMKEADIDTLLNDGKSADGGRYPLSTPRKSLFNSGRMYGLLRKAFDRMDDPERIETEARETADRIDLYVTATDLNGLVVPIELTDKPILERDHRSVFHFEYDPEESLNDFAGDSNAMLAFAARCTSSFPAAFEPMRFQDIQPGPTAENVTDYRHFFDSYHEPGKVGSAPFEKDDFRQRVFADGGYLDNRPFGYVIDRIGERTSNCPVSRKLVFVDPFPEHLEEHPVRTDFNFIDNTVLALTELPRYETIRQDLARINNANRLATRLADIEKRLFSLDPSGANLVPPQFRLGYACYVNSTMGDLLNKVGPLFVADQLLKVSAVSDWLALVATRHLGFNETGDYFRIVRLIVRAWRDANFASVPAKAELSGNSPENGADDSADGTTSDDAVGKEKPAKSSETLFIYRYDLAFRISRLRYLIYMMDRVSAYTEHEFREFKKHLINAAQKSEADLPEFSRKAFHKALAPFRRRETELLISLHRTKKRIEGRDRPPTSGAEMRPLMDRVDPLREHFAGKDLMGLLFIPESERQMKYAEDIYKEAAFQIDEYFSTLSEVIELSFDKVHAERSQLRNEAENSHDPVASLAAGWLGRLWDSYEVVGNVMARLLPHGQIGESGVVDIFRIGPADTDLTIRNAGEKEEKLAGTKLGSFGAFLSEGWRENDILWGRLDGAERLIVSLLPDAADRDLRDCYIRRVRNAILREEFDPVNGRIYRWLAGQVRTLCGQGLDEKKLVECIKQTFTGPFEGILKAIHENPERWLPFLSAYYDIPPGPDRRRQAEWLSRSIRIAGEMIESLGPVKGLGGKVKLAGCFFVELVQVSLPGSLRNLWFSHVLCLLMLAGVILIVLGALFTADFSTVGLKLLIYAGGLWLVLRCMRSWLSQGRYLKVALAMAGILIALAVSVLAVLGWGVLPGAMRTIGDRIMMLL